LPPSEAEPSNPAGGLEKLGIVLSASALWRGGGREVFTFLSAEFAYKICHGLLIFLKK
jgi:hypothetical protein